MLSLSIPALQLRAFRFLLLFMAQKASTGKNDRVQSFFRSAAASIFGARRRIATCAVVALAVMLGYHVVFGRNGLIAYGAKRDQMHDLSSQMTQLQRENLRLHGHVDRLSSDPNAIEHEAREALHYTRPGEVIYSMPASNTSR